MILEMIEQEIEFVVSYHTTDSTEGEENNNWNIKEIYETMRTIFSFSEDDKKFLLEMEDPGTTKISQVEVRDKIVKFFTFIISCNHTKEDTKYRRE